MDWFINAIDWLLEKIGSLAWEKLSGKEQSGKSGAYADHIRFAGSAVRAAGLDSGIQAGYRYYKHRGFGQCADPGGIFGGANGADQCDRWIYPFVYKTLCHRGLCGDRCPVRYSQGNRIDLHQAGNTG